MKFVDVLRSILRQNPEGLTPQQIRDIVKSEYRSLYGTETHQRNVDKGHYKDLDHALLAQIYVVARQTSDVNADKSTKPITLSLVDALESPTPMPSEDAIDPIETEDLARLEEGIGTVYVLGTSLYTKNGDEIVKVGITTGSVEDRVRQLYNTSVPTKFRVIETYDVKNYAELEQSLHRLLDPYRISKAREFFTEQCLPYVEKIAALHMEIQSARASDDRGDA
jgi:hypothetical protein